MNFIKVCFFIVVIFQLTVGCITRTNYSQEKDYYENCEFIKKVSDSIDLMKCKEYYKTGELYREGKYVGSIAVDWHKFYRKSGELEKEVEFVLSINDTINGDTISFVNQIIRFDNKGDTIEETSNYYLLNVENDTIILGDTFFAEIYLKKPFWDNSRIEFYFDIPSDSSRLRYAFNGDRTFEYSYNPIDTGTYSLNGWLIESIIDTSSIFSDSIIERYMYYNYKYYVKQN